MLGTVVFGEQQADIGELRPDEGLAARKIQNLELTELCREFAEFFKGQVVALVQVPPVEAVFAGQVADGVDEDDHERRRLPLLVLSGALRQPDVSCDAGAYIHCEISITLSVPEEGPTPRNQTLRPLPKVSANCPPNTTSLFS